MIINHLLELYAVIWVSIALHECSHYIAAKTLNLDVKKIHIGDKLFSIAAGKIEISLIIGKSYVDVYGESLGKKSQKQILLFFLAGVICNAILCVIAILLRDSFDFVMSLVLWVNVLLLIQNTCPFLIKGNDLNKALYFIRRNGTNTGF